MSASASLHFVEFDENVYSIFWMGKVLIYIAFDWTLRVVEST